MEIGNVGKKNFRYISEKFWQWLIYPSVFCVVEYHRNDHLQGAFIFYLVQIAFAQIGKKLDRCMFVLKTFVFDENG